MIMTFDVSRLTFDEDSMELSDYLRILRQRGWLIIVVAVVAAVSAFGFSKLQRPIYKSSMQMTVLPARNDMGLAQTTKQLLRAYVTIIDTKRFAAQVLERFEQAGAPLDMTPAQLTDNAVIASFEDKNVIQIDIKNGDGELGNRIAIAWAQEFRDWREQENNKVRKEDRVDVVLGDNPTYSKFRPQTSVNTAAGSIFGLLLGTLVVAALEWVESGVVRTAADVERKAGLPVLGTLPSSER
jgi:capsular polysaccharide biosynthesis protein